MQALQEGILDFRKFLTGFLIENACESCIA